MIRPAPPAVPGRAPLVIGLVNNMPDAALASTESQFRRLLSGASGGVAVELRLFSLRGVPRGEAGRAHVDMHHEDFGDAAAGRLDGLIVTGTEPRAPDLADEPYWPALAGLVDWAEDRAVPTVWSCLAAHAAVLRLDGIRRSAIGGKLCGLLECTRAADHAILAGVPPRWRGPHSRYNGLPEELLVSRGYQVLARAPEGGPDMFAREGKALFLFLQGHPEYDPGALLREYRRDVGRFMSGGSDRYPEMPRDYFEAGAAAALEAFRERALRGRSPDLLRDFPAAAAAEPPKHGWHEVATLVFANWLSHVARERAGRRSGHGRASAGCPSVREPVGALGAPMPDR